MHLSHPKVYRFLFRDIKWELLVIAIICVVIGELDDDVYLLDEFDLAIPSFLGTILVISIAFRTNKAYGRWWEAKSIWEEIANNTRAWNRLVLTYLDEPTAADLARKQIAWTYTLAYKLRKTQTPDRYLSIFSKMELDKIFAHDNPNQMILLLQSDSLISRFRNNQLPEFVHLKFENILRQLEVCMGKAERIKNTHFPHPYDLLIHITIYLFAIVSSYFIDDDITVFEASVSFIVSGLFLSFHYISRHMQDPFENNASGTPMLWTCHELEQELNDSLNQQIDGANKYEFEGYLM